MYNKWGGSPDLLLANVNWSSFVRPSVSRLFVCNVRAPQHPTQATEIFGNVSMPFGMLAIC